MRRNDVANWYKNKHQGQNISQYEIERKWRMHLWEEEQRQLAESINMKYSTSGGGGEFNQSEKTRIITENGIFIQTENNDYLIIE